MGARISSNSWGARNGSYIVECRETDRFVFTHPSFLPIFSSGNYGERGFQSVVAPATAKNCLAVGAVGNIRIRSGVKGAYFCEASEAPSSPGYGATRSSLGVSLLSDFVDDSVPLARMYSYVSGAGPTYDERIKPEVMAPGSAEERGESSAHRDGAPLTPSPSRACFLTRHYITSAKSEGSAALDNCRDCAGSLMSLFGTSMSAAVAAGSAAIVRQYYTEGRYPTGVAVPANSFVPSGALLKATLISSAVGDTVEGGLTVEGPDAFEEISPHSLHPIPRQTGPTPRSGFGRIQLDTVLRVGAKGPDLFVTDQRQMDSADFHASCFRVRGDKASGAAPFPFRATLVWSDPPAALSASWLLVNNLDLSVSDLSTGRVSVGNAHEYDLRPEYDSTNNVEQVTFDKETLTPGALVAVHVKGTNVPQGPQPYALLVSGSFESLPVQSCAGAQTTGNAAVAAASFVCPSLCSHRGVCGNDGSCLCGAGFAGVACAESSLALPFCQPLASSVAYGKWQYLHFDVPAPSAPSRGAPPVAPSLRVLMRSLAGQPDLYVSHSRLPTLQDHDFAHLLASVNAGSTEEEGGSAESAQPRLLTSQIDIPAALSGRYYIGVFGYCCAAESRFTVEATRCSQSTAADSHAPEPAAAFSDRPSSVASRACLCAAGL